ncbi:Dynactin Arp1 p25 subunit [Taphrina deformans PYCC 5710]|uniref:Dynactin subunit 5 n=1 Tax=Taphrina deformans (strain PYCC 5710 / ATCC 11124 / CBS 356.35 / IMI 108563 / JCM 9778 / NBRC 8474) TaxID=1097556 RepID=R4XHT5_TAPDE|nr:Dynactin Arp1 p25 subunit [Taphrina deformans PYCC 5710]|eukprot:CCG82977.1 Dynactin Arp1 p25 subunit [Taphrina deformans PYCC 5710]
MTTRTKEYILTESGNHISRAGLNLINTQSIVLGGKTVIESHVTMRGDLRRPDAPSSSSSSPAAAAITLGRYCLVGRGTSLVPPHRVREGQERWYPLKVGDYVHVGAHSTVSAASIASCVHIGAHCVIGNMSIVREGSVIEDGSVLPPYTVVAPFSRVSGKPALVVGECPEVMVDVIRERARDHYADVLAG